MYTLNKLKIVFLIFLKFSIGHWDDNYCLHGVIGKQTLVIALSTQNPILTHPCCAIYTLMHCGKVSEDCASIQQSKEQRKRGTKRGAKEFSKIKLL